MLEGPSRPCGPVLLNDDTAVRALQVMLVVFGGPVTLLAGDEVLVLDARFSTIRTRAFEDRTSGAILSSEFGILETGPVFIALFLSAPYPVGADQDMRGVIAARDTLGLAELGPDLAASKVTVVGTGLRKPAALLVERNLVLIASGDDVEQAVIVKNIDVAFCQTEGLAFLSTCDVTINAGGTHSGRDVRLGSHAIGANVGAVKLGVPERPGGARGNVARTLVAFPESRTDALLIQDVALVAGWTQRG